MNNDKQSYSGFIENIDREEAEKKGIKKRKGYRNAKRNEY